MNFLKMLLREIKNWFEFFIRNIPGIIGYAIRSLYFSKRLKKGSLIIVLKQVSE